MGCLLLLTCYVWLPCVLADGKLTASYTMKSPPRPDGVLAFTDVLSLFGRREVVSTFTVEQSRLLAARSTPTVVT